MDLEERRSLVASFLRKCVIYADDSINRKRDRGDSQEEIEKWENYRDFTEHAVMEVSNGELDQWLEEEERREPSSLSLGPARVSRACACACQLSSLHLGSSAGCRPRSTQIHGGSFDLRDPGPSWSIPIAGWAYDSVN